MLLCQDISRIQTLDKKLLKKAERSINEEKKKINMTATQKLADELSAEKIRRLQLKGIKFNRGRKVNCRSHLKITLENPERVDSRSERRDSITSMLD
jgi:hypothetical protein